MQIDPETIPLEKIDVSDPELHRQNIVGELFKRLRREDPVHYCAESPYGPYWSITRYKDILDVETNHEVFSSQGTVVIDDFHFSGGHVDGGVQQESFITMDPPKHDEQRKAVAPAVAPANLVRLEKMIRDRVAKLLDSLPVGEEIDWVDSVSVEITTQMLATLFDFPFEDRRKLLHWSHVASGSPGDGFVKSWQHRNEVLTECATYFHRLWQERLDNNDGSDFISMMARSPATRNMSPAEFLGNVLLLIIGGNDTTRNSMTASVLAFEKYPDQLALLREKPALLGSMVSEVIRWQTPVASMRRTATRDIEFQGKSIRKGDKVMLWYISGNRDEEVIEDPEDFIIDRPRVRQHLAFGFGIHRCLGNRLAEMQLKILWEEILSRFGRIEVMGEPDRLYSNALRGYNALPVRLHR